MLIPGTRQRGLQPLSFLSTLVVDARTLLESLGLGPDGSRLLLMLPLRVVQSSFAFAVAFSRFALPFPRGLLAPALGFAPLLLLPEIGGGLSGIPVADPRARLALPASGDAFTPGPRSDGRSECSAKRPFEPAGRRPLRPAWTSSLRRRRGPPLLHDTPMEMIAAGVPGLRCSLYRGAATVRS